jgi:hypothetical protein
MKIVRIGIDLENIEKCKNELTNSDIKKLIDNFYLGFANILSINSFPILLMSYVATKKYMNSNTALKLQQN